MDEAKQYSRSHDADAALPLRVPQTLDPAGSLVEGGQTSAQVGRVTAVCGKQQKHPGNTQQRDQRQEGRDFTQLCCVPLSELSLQLSLLHSELHLEESRKTS